MPSNPFRAMSMDGVYISDQQKAQIEGLVNLGDTDAAVKMVIDILDKHRIADDQFRAAVKRWGAWYYRYLRLCRMARRAKRRLSAVFQRGHGSA